MYFLELTSSTFTSWALCALCSKTFIAKKEPTGGWYVLSSVVLWVCKRNDDKHHEQQKGDAYSHASSFSTELFQRAKFSTFAIHQVPLSENSGLDDSMICFCTPRAHKMLWTFSPKFDAMEKATRPSACLFQLAALVSKHGSTHPMWSVNHQRQSSTCANNSP